MSTDIRWQHKRFTQEDRDRILDLRKRVFSDGSYDHKRWTWQYQSNPMGDSFIDLAVDKDEANVLAGHYAVISYKFSLGKDEVLGAQSLDTFTSPDYGRQGIFVELAQKTYQNSFDNGVKFIFGFPNKLSYPGFVKKLDFKDPFGFKVYKLPLRLGHYSKKIPGGSLFSKIPLNFTSLAKNIIFNKVDKLPADMKDLNSSFLDTLDYKVIRDENYLNWRYVDCPDRNYELFEYRVDGKLKGMVIGKVEGDFAHLVDIIPCEESDIEILVKGFVSHYRDQGIHCLTCFLNEGNFLESYLSQLGFSSTDKSDDFRFIIRTSSKDMYDKSMDDCKKWFLMGGDTDFY
ncbi:MAG: hypothetical protein BM556_04280 [Bacteriovorax sp. MedPE-SWde]|nr:MAG: hypothetical protein BM556_04280 [Bacteriovorax sp. MedPE-SWde]